MPKSFNPQDKFFKKAKDEGYRARSIFKLEEIQRRFHLIKVGDRVLDLGAAPGSFMQYIQKLIGDKGFVVGIDLKEIKPFKKPNVKSYVGDIFDEPIYERIAKDLDLSASVEMTNPLQFDVITSDLAPATTGIKSVDAGRSFQLNEQVLKVTEKHLKLGGHVVMKAFPGADHSQLLALAKKQFKQVKLFKPEAVRESSREVYVIGLTRML
ncbi:SAM-dependent methyltransferase [candidate division KSB1 bacterium]